MSSVCGMSALMSLNTIWTQRCGLPRRSDALLMMTPVSVSFLSDCRA